MKIIYIPLLLNLFIISPSLSAQDTQAPLKFIQKIPLTDVKGRIDHMAVDVKGNRLIVAAHDNNTAEVIDLKSLRQVYTIRGLSEPQGVFYEPQTGKLYIANGGNGRCDIFNGTSFKAIGVVEFPNDADNIRYDPIGHRVYVGYGDGGIGIIDGISDKLLHSIKLPSHPEAFTLEDGGLKIFVNLPKDQIVSIADRDELIIKANWHLGDTKSNFPMASDNLDHHIYVGCRNPAKLLILDSLSGKTIDEIAINGDTDDLFYDPAYKRIYVSCGSGFIDVIQKLDNVKYKKAAEIKTTPGARTSLFVKEFGRFFLAVPNSARETAAIWIYESQP